MASENVTDTLASQRSETSGGLKVGVAGQLSGVVCVVQVIDGGILSITTTDALHVPVLPQSSVAVQVRVVVYVPGHDPGVEVSEKVSTTVPSQASETVGGLNVGVFGQLIGVV